MRSVADDLRLDNVKRVLALSPRDRIALALALGRQDVDRYARANAIEHDRATKILAARRCEGRLPSRVASPTR